MQHTKAELPILYVEDELSNWEVAELRLSKRFKLLWASTAQQACDLIRSNNGQFHAVLMDIQLKGSELDGIALTQLFRGKRVDNVPAFAQGLPKVECPIFFITAFGTLHARGELVDAGGDDLVTKPVDFLKLSNLLATTHMRRAMETLGSRG